MVKKINTEKEAEVPKPKPKRRPLFYSCSFRTRQEIRSWISSLASKTKEKYKDDYSSFDPNE